MGGVSMDLKTIKFIDLFGLTFVVGGAFHLALALVGVVIAFLNPALFYSGGAQHVVARSPVEALGVVAMLAIFAVVFNLTVASGGAAAFIGFRTLGGFVKRAGRTG